MASVFTRGAFSDRRLFERAADIWSASAALFGARGSGEELKATRADQRGAQRLYANDRVSTKLMTEQGTRFMLERTSGSTNPVAMHDSSEINLAGRWEPHDAGPLRGSDARGYMIHAVVLVDPELGVSRGFVSATAWARPWEYTRNDRSRPAHRKESYKWKRGLMLVLQASEAARDWIHVMDREGDVHENFEYAVKEKLRVIVGARSEKRIAEGSGKLWRYMRHQPVREYLEVDMQSSSTGLRERRTLALRAATVELLPAKKYPSHKKRKPVVVNVVYVRGESEKQQWMLITTCPIDTLQQVRDVFTWYRARTVGEEAFKMMKTGLQLEAESVPDLAAFQRKLALLLPLATLLLDWRYRFRATPAAHADEHVDEKTLQVMKAAARRHRLRLPTGRWSIGHVIKCLAQLGGYEPRADQDPGWLTLWRGWRVFNLFRETFEFAVREQALGRA